MAVTITTENFASEIKQSDKPCLVDFWAPWCGPCKAIAPIIDEIAKEYEDKVKVAKVNVDESPEIASEFGIMSIPTMIVFQGGEQKESVVGALPKNTIVEMLQKYL